MPPASPDQPDPGAGHGPDPRDLHADGHGARDDTTRRGDRELPVDTWLERHLPELRSWIRFRSGRLVARKESASDVAQSVCREVIEHLDRFEHGDEEGFRRWLYRTAERKLISRYRYWSAEKRDVDREVDGLAELLTGKRAHTPSRDAIAREELEVAEAAFESLPEHYQQAILYSRVHGLSHAEIAERMGKSEGAVRNLVYRGLAIVAEALAGGPEGDGGDTPRA